jgi:preprotein translocase subunit SecG
VSYVLGFLNVVIVILTLFLIGIILIQRGKGGGLAGAFGGMGGSSAFGTRTGDVFTKVTVGVAIAWILLSMVMVVLYNKKPSRDWKDAERSVSKELDATTGGQKGSSKALDKMPIGDEPSVDPFKDLPVIPQTPAPSGEPVPAPKTGEPVPAPKK